jgi:hypothetical protein
MSASLLTAQDRDRVVHAYWETRRESSSSSFAEASASHRTAVYNRRSELLDEYGKGLPAVPISRCPFCGRVLQYVLDAWGLDGPWWHIRALADYPRPEEPHFRVLQGAIDFHGREPAEASVHKTVRPGPAVPFVIPRLLGLAGMRAVISTLPLPHGDTAYLIAYFSPEPIHSELLHQPWPYVDYYVTNEEGESLGWSFRNDTWDFDLKPWIQNGQVAWINPGDPELTLQGGVPCPYIDVPGVRAPQSIDRGKVSTLDLPTGEPLQPFE